MIELQGWAGRWVALADMPLEVLNAWVRGCDEVTILAVHPDTGQLYQLTPDQVEVCRAPSVRPVA